MYTPIIVPADLNSVIYPEIQGEISRNDNGAIVTEAIDTAIQEVKMYLTRYDLVQLFGDQGTNVSATFSDTFLKRLVKNIAIWHFIQLANVNVNYESQKLLYEQAVKSLTKIQEGKADPRWPYLDTTGEIAPQGNAVAYNSNKPKRNHF